MTTFIGMNVLNQAIQEVRTTLTGNRSQRQQPKPVNTMDSFRKTYRTKVANRNVRCGAIGFFVYQIGGKVKLRFEIRNRRYKYREYNENEIERI